MTWMLNVRYSEQLPIFHSSFKAVEINNAQGSAFKMQALQNGKDLNSLYIKYVEMKC